MKEEVAELRAKWEQALSCGAGSHEWRGVALCGIFPVRILAGVRDRDNHISLIVETSLENAPRHRIRLQAEGIDLQDQRIFEDRVMRLAVTLERQDLRSIFEVIAADLVTVAASYGAAAPCITQIIKRLEAWQACLRARQRGLNKEEQVGLAGELIVAGLIGNEVGLARGVEAWLGPLGATQDFRFNGIAAEVKTTIGTSRQIHISNLDQLDTSGLVRLLLIRVCLDETPSGHSLPERIAAFRARLVAEHPNVVSDFDEKLIRAGYIDVDADLYGSTRATINLIQGFEITAIFPRITRDNLPPAILEASYTLDESRLAEYRLSEHDLRLAIRGMGAGE